MKMMECLIEIVLIHLLVGLQSFTTRNQNYCFGTKTIFSPCVKLDYFDLPLIPTILLNPRTNSAVLWLEVPSSSASSFHWAGDSVAGLEHRLEYHAGCDRVLPFEKHGPLCRGEADASASFRR